MLIKLLEKGSWMTDYRNYYENNYESVTGSEGTYKGVFFMIHSIATILLSFLCGTIITLRELFLNVEIPFFDKLLINTIYIFIIMFITLNGIMVLSELMISIRKRIL